MPITVKTPVMGESITEATVAQWLKNVGDFVEEDELIAELETDKVNLEVTAPKAGKLTKIMAEEGATVSPDDPMAEIDETATGENTAATPVEEEKTETPAEEIAVEKSPEATPVTADLKIMPAAEKLIKENNLNPTDIPATGKGGRIQKSDVQIYMAAQKSPAPSAQQPAPSTEREERQPLSRIRKTIAKRLKTAQNTAALLTTYNEIDLSQVMALRKKFQDDFVKKNDIKLGFMSFFTKAAVEALKEFPALNAEIDGEELILKNYYDIGIAISSPRGLVVPVVRDANSKNFAQIEHDIKSYALKAKDGKLMPDDMVGATFSITNGGTFGSMLSMPIINYPQVGILGMHNIKERPVVVGGEIVIRPIMYVALTYDHRVVDGKEAVSFLVKIKDQLENPTRMLLEV